MAEFPSSSSVSRVQPTAVLRSPQALPRRDFAAERRHHERIRPRSHSCIGARHGDGWRADCGAGMRSRAFTSWCHRGRKGSALVCRRKPHRRPANCNWRSSAGSLPGYHQCAGCDVFVIATKAKRFKKWFSGCLVAASPLAMPMVTERRLFARARYGRSMSRGINTNARDWRGSVAVPAELNVAQKQPRMPDRRRICAGRRIKITDVAYAECSSYSAPARRKQRNGSARGSDAFSRPAAAGAGNCVTVERRPGASTNSAPPVEQQSVTQ